MLIALCDDGSIEKLTGSGGQTFRCLVMTLFKHVFFTFNDTLIELLK